MLFQSATGRAAFWDRRLAPPLEPDGGLVHRRLAIIDLSERGRQPMHEGRERLWLTYNGEIYNYLELMAELKALGYQFRSGTDSEVILHAYRAWGLACVERFNGMFAFALWDCEQQRLLCVRDRVGIKPFYYQYVNRRLVFASEIKAILAFNSTHPSADVAAVSDYLCYSYIPTAETMFRDIRKLPPGHRLVASSAGVTVEPYWAPCFEADESVADAERVEALRVLLNDAVRLQLRSDVPIGAHLSGGIDSSAVCSLAARHVGRLQTFTARFAEGGGYDESFYARIVANAIGADHHEIEPSASAVGDLLPRIVYHLDHPIEGAAVFGKFHVAEIVAKHVKVVLGGQGGDELFGGYDWYVKALFTAACYGARGAIGGREWLPFMAACMQRESRLRLARSLWNNFGCNDVSSIFCRNWSRLRPGAERRLLRAEQLNGAAPSAQRFARSFEALPERHPGDRMFHFDLQYYLEALLQSEDRLSMAFSVESRVPLLDHRIVELAARIGFEHKTVPGRAKDLLKRALTGIVPDTILGRRDKRGFPTPVDAWLRDPRLRLVERFVLGGSRFAGELFDLEQIRRHARQHVALGSSWSEVMWRVLNVSVWGERFAVSL